MKITLSMSELFPCCRDILERELRPLHYAKLTEMAIAAMGVPLHHVDRAKEIENVREKLAIAGQYGTCYVPAPYCLVALRYWFPSPQLDLLNADSIMIPGHAQHGANGAFEALMRAPYMLTKELTNTERLNRGRAQGFVTEGHVTPWFKSRWPEFFVEAENRGQWKDPCDHDFKLRINNRLLKIDVFGQRLNGYYRGPKLKPKADLHLLCRIAGQHVEWHGVRRAIAQGEMVFPETSASPIRMVVWLNCLKHGIDYSAIINVLHGPYFLASA